MNAAPSRTPSALRVFSPVGMDSRALAKAAASREGNLQIAKTPVKWLFLWCMNLMCRRACGLLAAPRPRASSPPGAPDSPFKKNLSESCQKARCGRSRVKESVESARVIRKARSSVRSARPLKRVARHSPKVSALLEPDRMIDPAGLIHFSGRRLRRSSRSCHSRRGEVGQHGHPP